MNKHREFWIYMPIPHDMRLDHPWSVSDYEVANSVNIHVIEKSAYDELEAKLKIAVEALDSVEKLMSGAPSIAPMTDSLVLQQAREALTAIKEGK